MAPPSHPVLGVCSWSLRASGPVDLAARTADAGLDAVQLALDPFRTGAWSLDDTIDAMAGTGIAIASGMMAMAGEDYSSIAAIRRTGGLRPDEMWLVNLDAAHANAGIAGRLGIPLVTFHAGFMPDDPASAGFAALAARTAAIADVFGRYGVATALETGQESAGTLRAFLGVVDVRTGPSTPPIGINFDPANMLLYGSDDPMAAFDMLADRIAQVHIKDALPSPAPDQWGTEMAVGDGDVPWPAFLAAARDRAPRASLIIERESGADRDADIRRAATVVRAHLGPMWGCGGGPGAPA